MCLKISHAIICPMCATPQLTNTNCSPTVYHTPSHKHQLQSHSVPTPHLTKTSCSRTVYPHPISQTPTAVPQCTHTPSHKHQLQSHLVPTAVCLTSLQAQTITPPFSGKLMAKQKVALECLSYHATASSDDTFRLSQDAIPSAETYNLYR